MEVYLKISLFCLTFSLVQSTFKHLMRDRPLLVETTWRLHRAGKHNRTVWFKRPDCFSCFFFPSHLLQNPLLHPSSFSTSSSFAHHLSVPDTVLSLFHSTAPVCLVTACVSPSLTHFDITLLSEVPQIVCERLKGERYWWRTWSEPVIHILLRGIVILSSPSVCASCPELLYGYKPTRCQNNLIIHLMATRRRLFCQVRQMWGQTIWGCYGQAAGICCSVVLLTRGQNATSLPKKNVFYSGCRKHA